jgi:DnaJ-class molecular chaperone
MEIEIEISNNTMKATVECYRCSGLGVIPWGDAPDECDPCEECKGHGAWIEEVKNERIAKSNEA